MPFVCNRLDKEYLERRREVPFLTERPSHYVKRIYVATQPIEEPERLRDIVTLMELYDGEDTTVFASDWPHHDFDHPMKLDQVPLREEQRRKVFGENALDAVRDRPRGAAVTGRRRTARRLPRRGRTGSSTVERARDRRLQHRRALLRAAQPLRAPGRAAVRGAARRPARSSPTPTSGWQPRWEHGGRGRSPARGTGSSTTCRRGRCLAFPEITLRRYDVVGGGGRRRRQPRIQPPSTSSVWPVTKPLSSPAKNAIARATSSTSPRRLIDCAASTPRHSASWSAWISVAAVGNAPGRDGVDADALRPGLARERAREADHRALRRDVGDEPRLAPVERDRGDVDDRAAAAGEHLRAHRLGEQEVAAHVGGEDRVPLRGVGLVPRAERVDRGVVDEDVGAAERLLRARGDRLDRRRVGDVGVDRERLAAVRLDRRDGLAQLARAAARRRARARRARRAASRWRRRSRSRRR